MKGMTPVRGYQKTVDSYYNDIDFKTVYENITPLTRLGIVIFIIGKIIGIMAVPTVFIPSLNMLAVPMIIMWGGCMMITIAVCSYDHFHNNKKIPEENQDKAEQIKKWLHDNPELKETIFSDLNSINIKG